MSRRNRFSVKEMLSATANEIRIKILKKLSKEELSFTELMQELNMSPRTDAGKFGYHLKTLVEAGLIKQDEESGRYSLTDVGKLMIDLIWELEDISLKKTRKLLVRTSNLTIEPFDKKKIIEALIREAEVPRKIAEKIAREAEERILELDIKYLTAPLIREFVNAILIEKGLEDYRHAMTRLGLPVYDVEQLISKRRHIPTIPDEIHALAGDAVMSEYTLLKQLPRNVADAHLSGAIHICNINYWALRPATIHHDAKFFLENGLELKSIDISFSSIKAPKSFRAAVNLLFRLSHLMQSNLSVGQIIDYFNYVLAPYIKGLAFNEIKEEIKEALFNINQISTARGRILPLALGLCIAPPKINEEYNDYVDEANLLLKAIIQVMYEGDDFKKPFFTPLPIIKINLMNVSKEFDEIFFDICKLTAKWATPYFINVNAEWQDENVSYGWDLSRLDTYRSNEPKTLLTRTGCLDAVFINLPRIALEARGNDDLFFERLSDVISICIRALREKRRIIEKRLDLRMLPLLSVSVNNNPYYQVENAVLNIGYAGLPEAVKIHTGFWLHEEKHALTFAKKIIDFMRRRIKGIRGRWRLASISTEDIGKRFFKTDITRFGYPMLQEKIEIKGDRYTFNANLPLHIKIPLSKRIRIESMFQSRTLGGHGLNIYIEEPTPNPEYLAKIIKEILSSTKIGAFTLSRDWTYCTLCGKLSAGIHERCIKCNRALKNIVYYIKKTNIYEAFEEEETHRVKYLL